jgi:flagellar biogenesis protein FliO
LKLDKKLLELNSTESTLNKQEFKVIPYKKSQSEFQEHGANVAVVTIGFLIFAWLVFTLIKKYIKKIPINTTSKKLIVLERTKISGRSSLLLVKYQNKRYILSQSGDSITLISEINNLSEE